jgi:phenylacetate-CoA oxygenase, PaaJ subunit
LEAGEPFVFIDVREPWEYEEFNLGAQLMPLNALVNSMYELDDHKNDEIVVHCRSGSRSAMAQGLLMANGFKNVRNLKGGAMAWLEAYGAGKAACPQRTAMTREEEMLAHARQLLSTVTDPEIPVLTVEDLGIVRDLRLADDGAVEVVVTPTYSGCPAMDLISVNIRAALQEGGIEKVKVSTVLSPAWTTEWLTESGKAKLKAFGIAPPSSPSLDKKALMGEKNALECPLCGSKHTEMVSQFGSTSCKALFRCLDCLEPFDYFKCH